MDNEYSSALELDDGSREKSIPRIMKPSKFAIYATEFGTYFQRAAVISFSIVLCISSSSVSGTKGHLTNAMLVMIK